LLLLCLGGGLGLAAAWSIHRIEAAAERRLSANLGARVDIRGLHWSLRGASAREIRIERPDGSVRLRFERVTVSPNVREWIEQRRLVIGGVEAAGVEVFVDEAFLSRLGAMVDVQAAGSSSVTGLPEIGLSPSAVVDFQDSRLTVSARGRERITLRGRMNGVRTPSGFRFGGSITTADRGRVHWNAGFDGSGAPAGQIRFQNVAIRPLLALVPEVAWRRDGAATVDGTVLFSAPATDRIALRGVLQVRAAGLRWPPVAETPIAADATLELQGVWNGRALAVEAGRLRSGDATIEWSGTLAWSEGRPFADVEMRLPETPCRDVLGAVPESLLGKFSRFALEGTMSASLRLHVDPPRPKATRVGVRVRDECRFLDAPVAADLDRFRGIFRHRVPGGDEETLILETGPGSPHWTPLYHVSPFLVHAVLAHEDATFFQHRGFAPHAFEGALARNLDEGRFAYGASTITMQLARNLFLVRDKTLTRKLKEILLAWWLEKNLTKDEILELYLNVIEFGPRTYGVGPAARHYFGRRPEELSPAESAFLAVLLPSPSAYERQHQQGRISSSALNQMERLLVHMERKGRIDFEALAYGLDELPRLRFHYGSAPAPARRDFMGWAARLPILVVMRR
jgi:hypothetical protein